MEDIVVRSGQGDYTARFFPSLAPLVAAIGGYSKAVLLVDRNVHRQYREKLAPAVELLPTLLIDATEEDKTLRGVAAVYDFLQQQEVRRDAVVVAVGGGIIQDIATFSAHTYYRGLSLVLVPSTLLAMADSCIGAKCGINHNHFKNQIGVFHSPKNVLISVDFLATLAENDVRSGYGEIVKLALTGSPEFFQEVRAAIDRAGFRNPQLPSFIRQSLCVKRAVIEADEYEADVRRILNYGHTFGHALESLTDYEIPHGLGVAWGVDLVNWIAFRRGRLSESDYRSVHDFLARHFRCRVTRLPSAAELIDGVRHDKKVAADKINLVLLERPGSLRIVPTAFDKTLEAQVTEYLDQENFLSGN